MAIRSFEKSWVVTIRAPAALDAAFKKCCMRSGRFDGSPRNYFFPRIADSSKTPRKQRGRRRKSPPAHSTSIPVADIQKVESALGNIELVDHAIISDSQSVGVHSSQASVRKLVQQQTQPIN